jgi:flagellar FliL protein
MEMGVDQRWKRGMVLVSVVGWVFFAAGRGYAADPPKPPAVKVPSAPAPAVSTKTEKTMKPTKTMYPLEPFLVNLADTAETRFARISIDLESSDSDFEAGAEEHLAQIRDSLLLLISSKTYGSLRTVEGKLELRDEMLERVNAVLGEGKATGAYFTEFVVQ